MRAQNTALVLPWRVLDLYFLDPDPFAPAEPPEAPAEPPLGVTILCADVLDVDLDAYAPFDACFCDPPYGLSFMGLAWDHGVPSTAIWARVLASLRPGASMFAFGGTRMFHRLMCNVEDAGFALYPTVRINTYLAPDPTAPATVHAGRGPDSTPATVHAWQFGQGGGWQGSNISKAIDKALGADRVVVGTRVGSGDESRAVTCGTGLGPVVKVTAPATPEAAAWEGYNTAIAHAWEPLIWAMAPRDGTFANNALKHGVAGLNIDAGRIPAQGRINIGTTRPRPSDTASSYDLGSRSSIGTTDLGRWPANVVNVCACGAPGAAHAPGCHVAILDAQSGYSTSSDRPAKHTAAAHNAGAAYANASNDWVTHGHDDAGGASRYFLTAHATPTPTPPHPSEYFYCAKVSARERGGIPHPTLKPRALCEYFARMLLPPPRTDGRPRTLYVPFGGVLSEAIGALRAGWERVIVVEKNPEWVEAGRERLAAFEGAFARELDLADLLRKRGHLVAKDFKAHGVRTADWRGTYVRYVERKYVPTGAALPGAGFSAGLRAHYASKALE